MPGLHQLDDDVVARHAGKEVSANRGHHLVVRQTSALPVQILLDSDRQSTIVVGHALCGAGLVTNLNYRTVVGR